MSKRILIAEDNPPLLKAITVRLEAQGFEVITSQDGYQAVDFARRHRPDLLVMDINMPAGDGFSVKERLSNIPELRDLRVVYITGEAPGKVDETARRLGAFAVIHKPFTTGQLVSTIRSALAEDGRSESLQSVA